MVAAKRKQPQNVVFVCNARRPPASKESESDRGEQMWARRGSRPRHEVKDYVLAFHLCRYSSVVEHVIGNDGVVSPILTSGTNTKGPAVKAGLFCVDIIA